MQFTIENPDHRDLCRRAFDAAKFHDAVKGNELVIEFKALGVNIPDQALDAIRQCAVWDDAHPNGEI